MFFLPLLRPLADTCEISDDAGSVVQILTAALGAAAETMFGNISAIVADGVWNIERVVVAPRDNGELHQLLILVLGEMLVQVAVEGATQ